MTVGQLFSMIRDLRKNANNLDEELFDAYQIQQLFKRPLGGLSGGMKQKVNAALSFLFNPEILILDEPTAGLDPISSGTLKDKIRQEREAGRTFILTSHVMSELEELSDRIAFLLDGRVHFSGTQDELKSLTGESTLERAIAHLMRQGTSAPHGGARA